MRPSLYGVTLTALFSGQVAPAHAVELTDLKGAFSDIHGRYAPAGDCRRQPQVVVDATGITVDVGGQTEKATRIEYATSFFGPEYSGIAKATFPFTSANGWPIMMLFNDSEKPGALVITGHDEGFQGGPPLSARNQALVDASPYARCK
jgi:hypothetical protein